MGRGVGTERSEGAPVEPVALERVAVHVGSPLLTGGRRLTPAPGPRPSGPRHPVVPRTARTALTTGTVVLIATAPLAVVDWRWSLAAAGTLLAGGLVHRIARRAPFGFGAGFIAFRDDLGWPVGVQEDDEVRWSWR